MIQARKAFIRQLVHYIQKGREVFYFDETSTHVWDKKRRVWQNKDVPVRATLNPYRGRGVTIFGALSSLTERLIWGLGRGCSNDNVNDFIMRTLIPRIENKENSVIVMDNLNSHKNPKLTQHLNGHGIRVLFTPVGCSDLNPIEMVWNHFKHRWRKHLFDKQPDIEGLNAETNVAIVLAQLESQVGRASRGSFRQMLKDIQN